MASTRPRHTGTLGEADLHGDGEMYMRVQMLMTSPHPSTVPRVLYVHYLPGLALATKKSRTTLVTSPYIYVHRSVLCYRLGGGGLCFWTLLGCLGSGDARVLQHRAL